MIPDPADIQFVVMDGRRCNPILRGWLSRFAHVRAASDLARGGVPGSIGVWRNAVAAWFLRATDLPWLVMLDDDMVPVPDTEALLHCTADVAGCHAVGRDGAPAHGGEDGSVGAGALKLSRAALERIGKPWFRLVVAADGLGIAECECAYFCRKARRFGYHPVRAGRIGHRVPAILLPRADDPEKAVLKFDDDPQFKGGLYGPRHRPTTDPP